MPSFWSGARVPVEWTHAIIVIYCQLLLNYCYVLVFYCFYSDLALFKYRLICPHTEKHTHRQSQRSDECGLTIYY